jgi:TetR/AcrR family transcriptional regulator, transcriptional repressor for nem operon
VPLRGARRLSKRLPPPNEDDPLQPVFRRLDAIQEMIRRRAQRKGGCVIGNLSAVLSRKDMQRAGTR